MGAFKNQIIAGQVEVGDRIPAPRPATSHVAFPERRMRRQVEREFSRSLKRDMSRIRNSVIASFLLGAVTVVIIWTITEVL